MNKKILVASLILVSLLIVAGVVWYYVAALSGPVSQQASGQKITYLASSAEVTKYCNGAEMDGDTYRQTINVEKTAVMPQSNPTKLELIKATIDAATSGNCREALGQANITENNGVVSIPALDAWAGVSIAMCSCQPLVEVNLLRIPGITQVVWSNTATVSSFEDCVAAGNLIMESYPRQCRHDDQIFVEEIGNEPEKAELIRLDSPRPNATITSPLTIRGQARGSWFFEASFPIVLVNWDGLIIAETIATAQGEWMTEEFVPFEATLTFDVDEDVYSDRGALILQKDNPSGLAEHDDALEIPVTIAGKQVNKQICTTDVKQCSDGSYVSRSGPNCQFATCPSAQ